MRESANPFPYQHHVAIDAAWLLDTLRDAVTSHHERLQIRHSIATLQGVDTRPIVREMCYARAALEQLDKEGLYHASA